MEQILGVAIGIVLICLLLSIIASHVREVATAFTGRRAVVLEQSMRKMVGDLVYEKLAGHPLIETISFEPTKFFGLNISRLSKARPNYIPSQLFTRVLLISLAELQNLKTTDVTAIVDSLPEGSELKRKLGTIILGIEKDAASCVSAVEQWYDGTMDRVNGLYKRHTQMWLIVLGMVLAVVFNANLFNVTERLWTSKDARDAVTATAQMYSCKDGQNCGFPNYDQARADIQKNLSAQLPLGYNWASVKEYWKHPGWGHLSMLRLWAWNITGWLLTAIAVSLGAPFWFDMLNKLVNLRLGGQKPDKAEPVSPAPAVVAAVAVPTPPDGTTGN